MAQISDKHLDTPMAPPARCCRPCARRHRATASRTGAARLEPNVVVEVGYAETLLGRRRDPVLRSSPTHPQ